jgi:hypothetical protein
MPLYTFAASTYHGAPHLRRRNNPRSCSGRVGFFGTSRPDRLHPRAEAHPTRGASGSSIPLAPKVIHPHFRHRRLAPLGWAVPLQQNSHNSSSISVFIRSPLQNFLRRSEAVRGKMLPKTIFPNSSPSSMRAVPSSRWAELTTNSSQGEKRASELPRTAHADADPSVGEFRKTHHPRNVAV